MKKTNQKEVAAKEPVKNYHCKECGERILFIPLNILEEENNILMINMTPEGEFVNLDYCKKCAEILQPH
jgi:hypothetical protein